VKKMRILLLEMMLMIVAFPFAAAAEDNMSDTSRLTVQGDGKATAAADKATVVLGVETRDASAARAAADNARLMNETIAALLAAGVAEKDIATSGYSLGTEPQDEPLSSEAVQNETLQFIASNMVTVSLNNTADVGRVLDAAVSAGSNSIQEVSFDLRDPRPQKDQALALAIEDARRKAEVAARAAGVNLERILEISEGYGYVSKASRSFDLGAGTPIQPSQMEITASVTLTYEIS
jgi:uncharacterized protein YggE